MNWKTVQTLVLCPTHASSVTHLVLRVKSGAGGAALAQVAAGLQLAPLTAGQHPPQERVQCSLGFTYRGLELLCVPAPYLNIFSRLAPAFYQGAPVRGAQLGDTGPSAPTRWECGFGLNTAHILVSLHGAPGEVADVKGKWIKLLARDGALQCAAELEGHRLGSPDRKQGEWVHFGFRDGETNHQVTGLARKSDRSTEHAPGEFLLGHANDSGFDTFGLRSAPTKVREFFQDSSFGVLRKMHQDVAGFEQAVERWRRLAEAELGHDVSAAWVKAKLGGRWPGGEAIRPGQKAPVSKDIHADFSEDPQGIGCPWGSHVRRMSPMALGSVHQRQRSLIRRGMPYGTANWKGAVDKVERGLLGLFFCASLEDQFEHLLGQWAQSQPLGTPDDSDSSDPLIGVHEDPIAGMLVPMPGRQPLAFSGFEPWTVTRGTVYAWHPSAAGVERILRQNYVKAEDEGAWL